MLQIIFTYHFATPGADINECEVEDHGCEHMCINDPGSFHCVCKRGFFLNENGKTCDRKSIKGVLTYLVYTNLMQKLYLTELFTGCLILT